MLCSDSPWKPVVVCPFLPPHQLKKSRGGKGRERENFLCCPPNAQYTLSWSLCISQMMQFGASCQETFLGWPRSHLDHIQQLRETPGHRSSSTMTLHSSVVAGSFRRSGNRGLYGHHWSPQQLEVHPNWPQLTLSRCTLLQLRTWSEDKFGWEITKILGKSEDRGGFDQCAHAWRVREWRSLMTGVSIPSKVSAMKSKAPPVERIPHT